MKTPLAWRLTGNLRRLALALASIGFVVLLMFMEIGFLNGCFDSSTHVYEKFDADLLIISRGRTAAYAGRFPRTRLYQAGDCPAVKRAIPMYVMAGGSWKLPGLIMALTVARLASILALTLGMCLVAGLMALNKVIQTDPADCF